jgi:hypothetical protein
MVKVNFVMENLVSFSVDQTDAVLDDTRVGLLAPALSWGVERTSDLDDDLVRGLAPMRGSSA